jgi:protein SCO1/2
MAPGRAAIFLPLLAAVVLLSAGCGSGGGDDGGYRGRILEKPLPKADFALTDTSGKPYSFLQETRGYVTLLYFGYTNCPDVCPTNMADIASVISKAPDLAPKMRVVFVTVDPARDTTERLRNWLALFNTGFIGLTGTPQEIEQAGRAALGDMWFPMQKHVTGPDQYTVDHSAFVIAYTKDNLAHIVYPTGPLENYEHDLPLLVRNGWQGP